MPVKNNPVHLPSLAGLVTLRAAKYDCGFRTAFIQWTSEEEKQGVTYSELECFIDLIQKENEGD